MEPLTKPLFDHTLTHRAIRHVEFVEDRWARDKDQAAKRAQDIVRTLIEAGFLRGRIVRGMPAEPDSPKVPLAESLRSLARRVGGVYGDDTAMIFAAADELERLRDRVSDGTVCGE